MSKTISTSAFNVGDVVTFGRERGVQTPGIVVKINDKRVKIKTMEPRNSHPAGVIYNVQPAFIHVVSAKAKTTKAEGSKKGAKSEVLGELLKLPAAPPAKKAGTPKNVEKKAAGEGSKKDSGLDPFDPKTMRYITNLETGEIIVPKSTPAEPVTKHKGYKISSLGAETAPFGTPVMALWRGMDGKRRGPSEEAILIVPNDRRYILETPPALPSGHARVFFTDVGQWADIAEADITPRPTAKRKS